MYELLFQDVTLPESEGGLGDWSITWSHDPRHDKQRNILETSSHCPVQAFPSVSFKINSDLDPQRNNDQADKSQSSRGSERTKFPSSVQRISVMTAAPAANESPHLSAVGFRRPCRLYGVMFRNRIPMSVGFQ